MDQEIRTRFEEFLHKSTTPPEHDPAFILTAFDTIVHDCESIHMAHCPQQELYLKFGFCWNWLRPHQTRWTADGGFAWPAGYGDKRYSHMELPPLDGHVLFRWNRKDSIWHRIKNTYLLDKRDLILRVALPARTHRHNQAAVHTLLAPGNATKMGDGLTEFYGFRKKSGQWQCTATGGFRRDGWHRYLEPPDDSESQAAKVL